MKKFGAKLVSIEDLFYNGNNFEIPLYQRRYTWIDVQIKQLLKDLTEFINSNRLKRTYYMGNVIFQSSDTHSYKVIDGQQRITTFLLILSALLEQLQRRELIDSENKNNKKYVDLLNDMVFYKEGRSSKNIKRLKLSHISGERELEKVILNKKGPRNEKSNFKINYGLIYEHLSEFEDKDILKWIESLNRIDFVQIELGDNDDEHKIFENINSKGVDLSIDDLIKNYYYIYAEKTGMSEEEKQEIQNFFDNKFERVFPKETDRALFIRQYIAYKTTKLISIKETKKIYSTFKDLMNNSGMNKTPSYLLESLDEFEKLVRYYEYFNSFNEMSNNEYETIMFLMKGQTTGSYFVICSLILDQTGEYNYNNKEIKISNEFKESMKVIEKYKIRREFSGMSDKVITRFIPTIMDKVISDNQRFTPKRLEEVLSEEYYDEPMKYCMPTLSKFLQSFREEEIYVKSKIITKHALWRIELAMRSKTKEKISGIEFEEFQIEHIVPQNIHSTKESSIKWQNALGKNWLEYHDRFKHTIANLTLTKDNQTMSNNSFKEKQVIYADSLLRMNDSLEHQSKWTLNEINDRLDELTNIAKNIWK